tara:strand:- start:708 stop:935 length:228 start_codon:yes stop_codon:yes gene_type:complete
MDFLKRIWNAICEFFNDTPVVEEAPSAKPKVQKVSKAKLGKLTKAQLAIEGRKLGVDVDQRQLKSKIVNEVYKAQ